MVAAVIIGRFGFIIFAIFGPLLIPLSLTDNGPEDVVVALGFASSILFALAGGVICWKLTARFAKDG